jgi:hypothetical protein
MRTRTNDKRVNYSHGHAQTKQQVGLYIAEALLVHFWCMDEPHVNTDSQDSP